MKRLALALSFVAAVALADTKLRMNNADVGAIQVINCQLDGGLTCQRDAGVVGNFQVAIATSTTRGGVEPGTAQTWTGQKTFGNGAQDTCVAHASLTACSSPNAGLHQCCSTHSNAQVWCNGTSNVELTGSSSFTTITITSYLGLYYSLTGYIGTATLPYAYTVTGASGFISAGTGAGSINMRYTDGTNNCDCSIDCDTDVTSLTCSGNCTYAANTLTIIAPNSDTCTTPPTIRSPLIFSGVRL